ncbi:hypothetical protein [Nitratidesulfovibrio vulgaris]|uniref:hypothetical protein n=1 Tax=Nitratidesulfovibrio vulgaris TaxID=881 RepID=UPI002301038D|nr:hypothetical protein [Nitratidesulfovibrio vulgaris]WCB48308.1 hypothetical protein PH214_16760 [Nitratidesulfovibrio vulgaris]
MLHTPDLAPLWRLFPGLRAILETWEGRTLGDVAQGFRQPGAVPSAAALDAMHDLVAPVHGEDVARALRRRLHLSPSVLAANHHGIECFPELVQAIHFFGLPDLLDGLGGPNALDGPNGLGGSGGLDGLKGPDALGGPDRMEGMDCSGKPCGDARGEVPTTPAAASTSSPTPPPMPTPAAAGTVIPVLSCTTVSLQSQVYPRGLLLTRRAPAPDGAHFMRLPLFPASMQDTVVCAAPPLTPQQVRASRGLWRKLPLRPWERRAADALIDAHVDIPEVYALPRFGEQASLINARLCRQRFPDAPHVTVVYIELERLAARLLARDLTDGASIVSRLLFDPAARRRILSRLAGTRGCWTAHAFDATTTPLPRTGSNGTAFFWTVDATGRRIPLRLDDTTRPVLTSGDRRFALEPEALAGALHEGLLMPGLFCSYVTLALQHGLRCHGGMFFTEYLPAMLDAVHDVLGECPAHCRATPLAALPLSVLFDDRGTGDDRDDGAYGGHRDHGTDPRPAGTVEMFAAGGLDAVRLRHLARTPADAVLPLSLRECYEECVPCGERPAGWAERLVPHGTPWQGVTLRVSDDPA